MRRSLSVAHLTALMLPPAAFIEAAARAGFDGVGLRLLRVTEDSPGYPLMDDPAALRATLAAMRATGVAVRDIEFVKITPEIEVTALDPLLDAGAALGASHLIAAPYDADHARLADRLAALAERAQDRGICVVLEFFPWTSVPDLATCWEVVTRAGPLVGLLPDALHFDRSNSDPRLLSRLPPDRVPFAHLCDAPRKPAYATADLLRTAREERLPPGEGGIDLHAFLASLPQGTAIALEVPMARALARDGADAVLDRLRRAADGVLSAGGR